MGEGGESLVGGLLSDLWSMDFVVGCFMPTLVIF